MDFFAEYEKLMLRTPRIAFNNTRAVNSQYANYCINNKNCYMIFGSDHNEDLMYGKWLYDSKDCVDCAYVRDSELCYECTDCHKCYDANFLQDCDGCRDSEYLYGCTGCSNCFCCAGLFRKSFCVLNKQYSEEEYFEKVKELWVSGRVLEEFERVQRETPRKFTHALDNENCTGDYIYHCKNTHDSYDVRDCHDCGYLGSGVYDIKDSYDVDYIEHAELCYEGISNWAFNCNFSNFVWNSSNCEYCDFCVDCNDLFGCISLKSKKFHILNEPYEKEEYFRKRDEIVADLRASGRYGQVFPPSPLKYEDTVAYDTWGSCV